MVGRSAAMSGNVPTGADKTCRRFAKRTSQEHGRCGIRRCYNRYVITPRLRVATLVGSATLLVRRTSQRIF